MLNPLSTALDEHFFRLGWDTSVVIYIKLKRIIHKTNVQATVICCCCDILYCIFFLTINPKGEWCID